MRRADVPPGAPVPAAGVVETVPVSIRQGENVEEIRVMLNSKLAEFVSSITKGDKNVSVFFCGDNLTDLAKTQGNKCLHEVGITYSSVIEVSRTENLRGGKRM